MVCRRERFDNGRNMSESGSREAAATRSQGVVHRHLRSHEDAARLLATLLGRAHEGTDPSILVVAPTPEDALRLSELRAMQRAELGETVAGHLLTPITSHMRGRRQLAAAPPAIIGAPETLLELVSESRLRLGGLRAVALVWPEELLPAGHQGLEALLSEVPRTADRVAIIAQQSPQLDEFLDRVMWRARRIDHLPAAQAAAVPVRFLTVGPQQRIPALRALLDALDPERAAIITFTDASEASARRAVSALGVEEGDESLRVVRGAPDVGIPLVILLEPPDAESLLALSTVAGDIVAIVEPTDVAFLRSSAGGGAQPFPAGGPLAAAQSELDALRERVRAVVAAQGHLAWMPVVEPLLTDLDPVEVAAGAMALMHRSSRRSSRDERASEAASGQRDERAGRPAGDAAAMTRLFFGVGERDGIRRNDLVGAITAEAGIAGTQIGKIVLRESHAVVEIESGVAAQVLRKLGGTSIRGRKLVVREDREASPTARGGSRPRPDRTTDARGGRGASRRDAGERPKRGREREEIQRIPRAASEGEEWASRGDRLRHARRGAPKPDRE
jgi:ATP-dependent RNA helicase DeaD